MGSVTERSEHVSVKALLAPESRISIHEARAFRHSSVEFLDVPVSFNGEQLSGSAHRSVLPSERHTWSKRVRNASLAGIVSGDLEVLGMASGELRVVLDNVVSHARLGRPGWIVSLRPVQP